MSFARLPRDCDMTPSRYFFGSMTAFTAARPSSVI
jgi:hypothetical protein